MTPEFPILIPSKGRARTALTPHALDRMNVPYRLVVEEEQWREYADVFGRERLLVLDKQYQRDYDTCDPDKTKPVGAGAARNFAWDVALSEGYPWHWDVDDNIELFARLHRNQRVPVGDGTIFRAMEAFVQRYENVGLAGPEYWMFVPSRQRAAPFSVNRRIFSCSLIRNDMPVRWKGRLNEDLLLSIQVLRAGYCTVLFRTFLQYKKTTQKVGGGYTDTYRKEGTLPKSRLAVRAYPDLVRLAVRYGRAHHVADLSEFRNQRLIRRPDFDDLVPAVDPYPMRLVPRSSRPA